MSKIAALRDLVVALLLEHERDGTIPTNARFLFYELVQRGQISKEKTGVRRSDQNLHDALTDVREDGRIPWDWIIDETRSLEDYTAIPLFSKVCLQGYPTSSSTRGTRPAWHRERIRKRLTHGLRCPPRNRSALHGRTFDRQEIDTSECLLSISRAGEIDTRTVEAHSLKKPVQRSIPRWPA